MANKNIQDGSIEPNSNTVHQNRLTAEQGDCTCPALKIEKDSAADSISWRVSGEIDGIYIERAFCSRKQAQAFAERAGSSEYREAMVGCIRTLLRGDKWLQLIAASDKSRLPIALSADEAKTAHRPMKASAAVTVTDFSEKPYKNGRIRNKPWRVRFYADGKAKCSFFSTRDEAEAFATQQRQLLNRGLDPEDFRNATLLAKGTGFTLTQLAEMAISAIKANGTVQVNPNLTFAEGATMVMDRAERRGCRPKTIAGYKASYGTMIKAFGSTPIALIDRAFVQNYVDSLKNVNGTGPASRATKRTVVTNIRMVLAIAGVVQPLRGVETQVGARPPVKFYTNDQVRALLAATLDEDRGMVALGLFGTVRPLTLERLLPENINVEERKIVIPAHKSKDKVTHLIEAHAQLNPAVISPGAPDVLWDWLEKYPFNPRRWVTVQNYLKRKLGFWITDGLRHTGATNYCALWGVQAASELLTHKGTSLVKRHYAGATWKKAAQEFMNITPDSIPSNPGNQIQKRVVNWPTDAALSELLFKHTRKEVAKQLGCDVSTISNRCKKRGIAHPSQGGRTAKLVDAAVPTAVDAVDSAA